MLYFFQSYYLFSNYAKNILCPSIQNYLFTSFTDIYQNTYYILTCTLMNINLKRKTQLKTYEYFKATKLSYNTYTYYTNVFIDCIIKNEC